jgi:hypothetical protein
LVHPEPEFSEGEVPAAALTYLINHDLCFQHFAPCMEMRLMVRCERNYYFSASGVFAFPQAQVEGNYPT